VIDTTPTLQLEELDVRISQDLSLSNISFQIHAGEVAAIIGPNGAGKTSLLRAICNELDRQSGALKFNGRDMAAWKLSERAKLLAILPQRSVLDFPFSVSEVVSLGRIPHSSSQQQNAIIVEQALELVDCLQFTDRLFLSLSGGEKQRVQLARVAAQIWERQSLHRCLILDEPSASLDLAHQEMIAKMIRFFAEQGVAIVTVLHDLNLASQCADKLLVLKDGSAIAQGRPVEVLSENLISEAFNVHAQLTTASKDGAPRIIT